MNLPVTTGLSPLIFDLSRGGPRGFVSTCREEKPLNRDMFRNTIPGRSSLSPDVPTGGAMAYSEEIDGRVMNIIARWKSTDHKKMFGGVCHLYKGNMVCGVLDNFLILRLGVEEASKSLDLPHVRPFDVTGKPMKGWVMVGEKGIKTDNDLISWLKKAKKFVATLPPK